MDSGFKVAGGLLLLLSTIHDLLFAEKRKREVAWFLTLLKKSKSSLFLLYWFSGGEKHFSIIPKLSIITPRMDLNKRMARDSILGRLVEGWHVQYDRVIWNLYAILLAIAGIFGKDIILSDKSLQEILKAGSVASWYVLLATLMLTSFLFWYNYTSLLLSFASFLLIENDALYKKFWADRSRIRASTFQVLVSNCIFYALPLFVVVYYNIFALADLNTNLIFNVFAMFCGLYFLTAFIMRIITLLRIRAKFKLLLENIEKQNSRTSDSLDY